MSSARMIARHKIMVCIFDYTNLPIVDSKPVCLGYSSPSVMLFQMGV